MDDDLRDRLTRAVAEFVTPAAAATLFQAVRPASAPAPRAEQETLFTVRRTRRHAHHRLAAAPSHRQAAVSPAELTAYLAHRAAL